VKRGKKQRRWRRARARVLCFISVPRVQANKNRGAAGVDHSRSSPAYHTKLVATKEAKESRRRS